MMMMMMMVMMLFRRKADEAVCGSIELSSVNVVLEEGQIYFWNNTV